MFAPKKEGDRCYVTSELIETNLIIDFKWNEPSFEIQLDVANGREKESAREGENERKRESQDQINLWSSTVIGLTREKKKKETNFNFYVFTRNDIQGWQHSQSPGTWYR